ncbi:MAG: TetR/AcrR family transcriptional regulator [Actinomycetota bacterium]
MPVEPTADNDELSIRQRLVDAALATATDHGISRLSMADVAKRAGLSRQTLYRYFPSKGALVNTVVLNETAKLVEQITTATADLDDPLEALRASILAALVGLRTHPLLDRLLSTEPDSLVPILTTDSGPVVVHVRAIVESIVAERTPELTDDPVGRLRFADVVARLLISYAVNAPEDPPEVVADYVANFLVLGALRTEAT